MNIESIGIRPRVNQNLCEHNCDCLKICPGYYVNGHAATGISNDKGESDLPFGPALEIWEGHATDPEIRHTASSGGILSAIALYCLEYENLKFVVHTGMNASTPYLSETVVSYSRNDLIKRAGSRYNPASPCDKLGWIENQSAQGVFIGKPCDATAVSHVRVRYPQLNDRLKLVLTFFCAGTPSTLGTLNLMKNLDASPKNLHGVRYRGNGWPGNFLVSYNNQEKKLDYESAWANLQKFRPFRCHLCPDGLGQVADISCGDAWHKYSHNENEGLSIILIRTERGREVFHRAITAGYIQANPSNIQDVIAAQQNLLERRKLIFGRLFAMKLLSLPIPKFSNFHLFKNWLQLPLKTKLRTIMGTMRRLVQRGLWHRNDPFNTKKSA